MAVIMVVQGEREKDMIQERYNAAQEGHEKKYAMAQLITTDGQLEIEGIVPRIAVVDTGASAVILGRSFARRMDRCHPPWLVYGDSFITAGGHETKSLGRTKLHLKFVLSKGNCEETTIHATALIADTDAYDVILGMDFLGPCFGYMDPLTEEFLWRVDCHDTKNMPSRLARLPAKCRAGNQMVRNVYMIKVVTSAEDLDNAMMGDEHEGEDLDDQVSMVHADVIRAPMQPNFAMLSHTKSKLNSKQMAVHRKHEANARLDAALRRGVPVLEPRTKWIGDTLNGAVPVSTCLVKFDEMSMKRGLHVLDMFSGITCGGLRTVLEAGFTVRRYTSIEIDDVSRAIARKTLSDLQEEYPGQLPDKAILNYNKRLPQNIELVTEADVVHLVQNNGSIDFVCGGWECQSMSMAGHHKGMEDERFLPFLDMVKILNFLQQEQSIKPLFLFENTWPGEPGRYPNVDKAAKLVESFIGAPVTIDAAGLGSVAHRIRLFWTNWCRPEILQEAIPKDILPNPTLKQILSEFHVPTIPSHNSRPPFAKHNVLGKPRVCMPTIVSFPKSFAYRLQANNKPGEGQLWNTQTKCWEEPNIEEREQMMGYTVGSTSGGMATDIQRVIRIGRAMDGNTMRWLGAFLYAMHRQPTHIQGNTTGISLGDGWEVKKNRIENYFKEKNSHPTFEDPHHQACAVVEKLLLSESIIPNKRLGGSDTQTQKRQKNDLLSTKREIAGTTPTVLLSILKKPNDVLVKGETPGTTPDRVQPSILQTKRDVLTKEETPGKTPDRVQPSILNKKWKIGGSLTERDQLDVLRILSANNDRFAYSLEELSRYTGPAMEINLNSKKDIFRPPHKLGEKELAFVGEQCEKLAKLGFIRKSDQSHYAAATVVVRKKDENGEYTDFRKCGDYRPLNLETDQDRYQLPLIDTIFNDMKGARIFSKLDLRSGYHQMTLRESDRSKTAFWGTQRVLWEWCVVPFGLKNAPPYFQKQMDKVLINLPFARCYIDDIVIWSSNMEDHLKHLTAVFARLRVAGLKVHPGKCVFAIDKIDFLGHCVSAEGLSPQEEKVSAVRDLPAPTDISSLRSALGLFSYYRKFVKDFSVLASPLHALLRKGVKWHWGIDQQTSFADLKDRLCTAEVLRRPDSTLPYVLATDWSQKGMGAVLSQIDLDGKEHPVSYASRSCNPAEKNYGSCEGECLAVVWATQHFREYLFCTPFTLITDHEPLKWLMKTNKTTGKLARWSLLLQEYDMTVVHKRGVLNTNADCLSRFPNDTPRDDTILPDWNKGDYNISPETVFAFMETPVNDDQTAQLEIWMDEPVLHFLRTHKYQEDLDALSKDRVYRRAKGFRWLAHNLYKIDQNGSQMLLIPLPEERGDLVKKIHRDMGHFGVKRILDRLRRNYWWKGMDNTVAEVVKACMPCARTKAGFRVSGKELQPLHLQGLMFRWGIDFAGPMPESERGNKYVLVCIEHMTKWVELIALPDKSSANVARAFLENILSRYGAPGVVLTDQGTEFQGDFQVLLSQQEITHRITSKENPQADGLAERMVQTLKQSLRRCLLDQTWGLPWDDILPYVAMGYRISKQKSTGYSPYFLMYGRQPLFPSTIQHLDEEVLDTEPEKLNKLKLELVHRGAILKTVMPLAMRNLAIAQERDKNRFRHVRGGGYDKPKAGFAVGEYVLVRMPHNNTLLPSVRPHILRIIELRDTGVAKLQGSDGTTTTRQIHQLAHCTVPVSDHKIYMEKYVKTRSVHCQICSSREDEAVMLLCDTCNKGYHTFCLTPALKGVPDGEWHCEAHKVNP